LKLHKYKMKQGESLKIVVNLHHLVGMMNVPEASHKRSDREDKKPYKIPLGQQNRATGDRNVLG
jgi:hypothetical protein